MVKLINSNDKEVMNKANFVKNAVLYKDLFAFYDAYTFIVSQEPDMLPNYCFLNDGSFCLEGICLLIKDYASELNFESIKLTIEYLKVIYYTIASYSKDDNFPNKKIIEAEFNNYKKASEEISSSSRRDYTSADDKFLDAKSSYDKMNENYGRILVSSKILNALSIVFLVCGVILCGVSLSLCALGIISFKISIILSLILFVFGVGLFFVLRKISKKQDSEAGEIAFTMQGKKRSKDELEGNMTTYLEKYNRVIGERYEYSSNFGELLNSFRTKLSYDDIIRHAREYKLLSYNIRLDVLTISINQDSDVVEIKNAISKVTKENSKEEFSKIYREISKKDWLYYSNEVRLEFLKKFVDISEATFDWKIVSGDEVIRPFGIDIKSISKEKVTYLKSRDGLFISSNLDKLMGTKYFKSLKELDMVDINNLSKIRNVKMQFYSHFFDYEKTKNYNNLFYSDNIEEGVKISEDILNNTAKIPTYVLLKLKLIENKLKIGNADNSVIKQISEYINKLDGIENEKIEAIKKQSESIEEDEAKVTVKDISEYSVEYNTNGETFVGYKLSSL